MKQITALFTMALATGLAFTSCSDDSDLQFDNVTSYENYLEKNVSPFTRAAVDPTTLADFRRTYGVGFSYDGIWGEKCNLKDVHSQVFDFQQVDAAVDKLSTQLLTSERTSKQEITCETSASRSEYVQNVLFTADVDANLVLINGKGKASVSVWECGDVNSFFCVTRFNSQVMRVTLDGETLAALVGNGHTELLSKNFKEAVDWMAKYRDELVVDSFLRRYGSHVVTEAYLGGSLSVEMEMKKDSMLEIRDTKLLGELTAEEVLKLKSTSEDYSRELHLMNSADCWVTVKGGDMSKIPSQMMHFDFGKHPDLGTYAQEWVNSIKYDPDSYQNSNMEIIRMDVKPIWMFIPNKDVAERVKKHIMGTAADLLQEVGYQNGVNTAINMADNVRSTIGGSAVETAHPAIVSVIAAGRYVATICRERIAAIDQGEDVRVVYPIYDREVNLNSGFCVHKGNAYQVRNIKQGYVVNNLGPVKSAQVYLNGGVPGTAHYDNVNYVQSYNVLGIEYPKSIKTDGSVNSQQKYYTTYKEGRDFLLANQSGSLDGLPNWHYDSSRNRMVRNSDYKYYWNPKEIKY